MKNTAILLAMSLALSACTWETYRDENGKAQIRQKYPTGTGVYYTNGAASQNMRYHDMRPQQHAIVPQNNE